MISPGFGELSLFLKNNLFEVAAKDLPGKIFASAKNRFGFIAERMKTPKMIYFTPCSNIFGIQVPTWRNWQTR